MPETIPQTLKEALIAEGEKSQSQVNLLTIEAENLDREYFISTLNTGSWGEISINTLDCLRQISVIRIKNGQPVFPWDDQDFLDSINEDFLQIQFVY